MAGQWKVVIVDDDEWKRVGMATRLDATSEIDVIDAVDQDAAASWPIDAWESIDAVVVDIFDDRAPGEVGTDLYSGITVIEKTARLPVRSIAVTPSCAHPLVQLRLLQAHPDYCYHRFELASLEALTEALKYPDRSQQLPALDSSEIRSLGARNLLANDVVRTYTASPLYGRLRANTGLKELKAQGISRRTVDGFKAKVVAHGYAYADTLPEQAWIVGRLPEDPRWPVVRNLVLTLLGRLDAPWSEFDRPWWG